MSYRERDREWEEHEFVRIVGKAPWEASEDERHAFIRAWPEHLKEIRRQEREAEWKNFCPPVYRENNIDLLPNVKAFHDVQNLVYGSQGLLALGESRRGKTRSMYMLLKRLRVDERRSVMVFGPMDLKLAVTKAWKEEEPEQWIRKLRSADVLFLDDFDTVKFTEAVEETIYDIFEFRPMHGLPVLVTLNQAGPELANRMNAHGRGTKIVERMRESCEVVDFD